MSNNEKREKVEYYRGSMVTLYTIMNYIFMIEEKYIDQDKILYDLNLLQDVIIDDAKKDEIDINPDKKLIEY